MYLLMWMLSGSCLIGLTLISKSGLSLFVASYLRRQRGEKPKDIYISLYI